MTASLLGKKVIVAGAGGLIGGAIVAELIKHGAKVLAADISVDRLEHKLNQQKLDLSCVKLIELNITDEAAVSAVFEKESGLSGAVNATYPKNQNYGAHFYDVKLTDFNENLSLHLGSAFLFTQKCADYFSKRKEYFSLVNFSSIYGVVAPRFAIYQDTEMTVPVEYVAIKSAIINLSRYAVNYVADSSFRVNCISPGGIIDNQPAHFIQQYEKQTLGTGLLEPSSLTGIVSFLLSDASKYINGQNIIVDDGFTL